MPMHPVQIPCWQALAIIMSGKNTNDHPCNEVGNNLHNVEQHDLFLLESAVLDRIFCSEKSDQNTEYRIWEYPAPPYASIKQCITDCMSQKTDNTADYQ